MKKCNDEITQTAFEDDPLDKTLRGIAIVILFCLIGFIIFAFLSI